MSFEYYVDWWISARNKFEDLYQRDQEWRRKAKPIKERKLANKLLGGFYAKYSMLVQELDTCLDQLAQPQKGFTMRKLMDAATIRLSEFNTELRKIDFSEYHYIDDTLVELKLVPYDVEILHPALFYPRPLNIEDMWQRIKGGEKIYIPYIPTVETSQSEEGIPNEVKPIEAQGESKPQEQPPPTSSEKQEKKDGKVKKDKRPIQQFITEEKPLMEEEIAEIQRKLLVTEKVKIIQNAERARQARIYYFEKDSQLKDRKKMVEGKAPLAVVDPEVTTKAANKIQSVCRGHATRLLLKKKEKERRLLIGMTEPSWRSKEEFELLERNLNKRRAYRDQRIREYIEAIDKERARVLRVVAPGLAEDIGDEIREWFYQWYSKAYTFDKYPPEAKGGTILVVRGETMTPEEYLRDFELKQKEKEKNKGKDKEQAKKEKEKKLAEEKKKKEMEKKKKEAEAKRKKKKKVSDFEYEYEETFAKPLYDAAEKEFKEIWDQKDDFENPLEKHYMDMITENECYLLQLEVRKTVDELMELELELLVDALEKDRANRKGKKYKKKKAKKKKAKKKKKGKKDPTGNKTTEELFQELFDAGIIRTYPAASLEEYRGDFSYKNWDLRVSRFDPPATLLDVRQAVVLNCIIPLGVECMKRPRSVLICGPRQSGKHLLANAIFNETKCVLFDLSPENTAGKYPGVKGMKMLIHLVNKMSRLLAPSIIYFDAAEKIFYKKVPKEEKHLDPKRIGNKLLKGIVKTITPADRVLVLGISGKPWAAQAAKLKKTFERNILIPRADYASLYLYWRELLMPYHGIDRDINITSLATVTINYPFSVIRDVVAKIMTPRRIIQLKYNPLEPTEIFEMFISEDLEPVSDKEYNKYLKWYYKTPLGKERAAFNKFEEGMREAEKAAQEKMDKSKKK